MRSRLRTRLSLPILTDGIVFSFISLYAYAEYFRHLFDCQGIRISLDIFNNRISAHDSPQYFFHTLYSKPDDNGAVNIRHCELIHPAYVFVKP